MRFGTLIILLAVVLAAVQTSRAQTAEKITMRLRVVCNYGPGGDLIIAVDLKKKAGGLYIGGYGVNFHYPLAKILYVNTSFRYATQYWGFIDDYFDNATPDLQRIVMQKAPGPGNALPLTSSYFSTTTNCAGANLNDGFWELLRLNMTVRGSAQGTANFVFENWLSYHAGGGTPGSYETFTWNGTLDDNVNDVKEELFNIVVPVELVLFEGEPLPDGQVRLSWRTLSETTNLGFEVQRRNGEAWEKIGFVRGQGNSTARNDYSFIDAPRDRAAGDNIFPNGSVTYRLKQIDADGTEAYSPIVAVDLLPGQFALGQNYPNPALTGSLVSIPFQLPVESGAEVAVYNALGQKVAVPASNRTRAAGYYTAEWDARAPGGALLPAGLYLCTLNATLPNGERIAQTRRITLIK